MESYGSLGHFMILENKSHARSVVVNTSPIVSRSSDVHMSSKTKKILLALRYADNFILSLSTSVSSNSKLILEAMAPCNFNIQNRETITQMKTSKFTNLFVGIVDFSSPTFFFQCHLCHLCHIHQSSKLEKIL